MANSYVRIILHCVWSTKNREMCLNPEWEQEHWAYIAGIARNHGIIPVQIGGIENHVHAVVEPPKSLTVPKLIEVLKTPASGWINRSGRVLGKFRWQDGYGAFSVSPSMLPRVVEYVRNQREHHHIKTFEEEYRDLLRWHGVDFEEAYLLG